MFGKPGRHVPAFVLLMLAEKPKYGLEILSDLQGRMPHCLFDSAAIYKVLGKLEDKDCVAYEWDTSESGPPKKVYTLTAQGQVYLTEFYEDILQRRENLNYFIDTFNTLKNSDQGA